MGPVIGTIGGFGTWFSLVLKTAFALIGMGAYLSLWLPGNYMTPIAVTMAILFAGINIVGAKESGTFQVVLVAGLLFLLGGFVFSGLFHIDINNFSGFFSAGSKSILSTAGLVYISYVGVTKIASISEEVKDPERNLPLGMFLAFGTALLIYGLGTYVIVGVLPPEQLHGNLTPVASAAEHMVGTWGKILVTIAAIFAFSSVTNAGILSASRYPLAMSRDHLIPEVFRRFNKRNVPQNSILLTLGVILVFIIVLNPMKIAKLASSFQLFIFALCCLAVVIMRESKIEAYDPGYHAPFYPWLQIVGVVTPLWLIVEMGWMPILFSFGLVLVAVLWFIFYARKRVVRGGAIYHVFQRLGERRFEGLESELRGILKEKGLREDDPFHELVARATVLDLEHKENFDQVIKRAAQLLAQQVSYPKEKIENELMQGTKVGATPVSHGVALPHMRLNHIIEPELLLVRCKPGVEVNLGQEFWGEHTPDGPVYAFFFLISPENDPGQHLRILANIASRVDEDGFMKEWLSATKHHQLRELLFKEEHFISVKVRSTGNSSKLIGKKLMDVEMPEGSLVAIIRREGKAMVPRGSTVILDGDRLTIIGEQEGIQLFRQLYGK